jgi:hypothetical protein
MRRCFNDKNNLSPKVIDSQYFNFWHVIQAGKNIVMKSIWKKVKALLIREWFLLVMVATIVTIFLIFEQVRD